MKTFLSTNRSSLDQKKRSVVLSFALLTLGSSLSAFVVLGCRSTPEGFPPGWRGGMVDYPVEDDSIRNEWNLSYGSRSQGNGGRPKSTSTNSTQSSNNSKSSPNGSSTFFKTLSISKKPSANEISKEVASNRYSPNVAFPKEPNVSVARNADSESPSVSRRTANDPSSWTQNDASPKKSGNRAFSFRIFRNIFGGSKNPNAIEPTLERPSPELLADNKFYPADLMFPDVENATKSPTAKLDETDLPKVAEINDAIESPDYSTESLFSQAPILLTDSQTANVSLKLANAKNAKSPDSRQKNLARADEIRKMRKAKRERVFGDASLENVLANVEKKRSLDPDFSRSICDLVSEYNRRNDLFNNPTILAAKRTNSESTTLPTYESATQESIRPVRYQNDGASSENVAKNSAFETFAKRLDSTPNVATDSTNDSRSPNASEQSSDSRTPNVSGSPSDLTNSASWKEQTQTAIQSLRQELEAKKRQGILSADDELRLRFLCLSVGDTETSDAKISLLSEPVQEFWQSQFSGLSTLLDRTTETDDDSTTLQVAAELQRGLDSLSQICPIQIRKAILVQEMAQYGLYQKKIDSFKPGETVYVYAELDHVQNRSTNQGEEIGVHCSWELRDLDGKTILPRSELDCDNVSESRLRDVVLNIRETLPDNLAAGRYHLVFSVVDKNNPGCAAATETIQLQVAP